MKIINTIEELDQILDEIESQSQGSYLELQKQLPGFRMEYDLQVPDDPYSTEYRNAQFALYEKIAGQPYAVENEVSDVDVEAAVRQPYPYNIDDNQVVGDHLIKLGNVVRALELDPGSKIIELGAGWGDLSLLLALMGFDVTAVEINQKACQVINRRANNLGVELNVVHDDFFYIEQLAGPVDALIFLSAFHHCADHVRLIRSFHSAVKRTGSVYLAGEPINSDFPLPWGLRLDGESLWAIRSLGWLELGFSEDYFIKVFEKFDWLVEKQNSESDSGVTIYKASQPPRCPIEMTAAHPGLLSQIGVKGEGQISVTGAEEGFLVYGPYIGLNEGKYSAIVEFKVSDRTTGTGRVDIACDTGEKILASKGINFSDLHHNPIFQIDFMCTRLERDLEVRLFCHQGAAAGVSSIRIVKR